MAMRCLMCFLFAAWLVGAGSVEVNRTAEGYPVGFLSNCKGSEKPAVIPDILLKELKFVVEGRTRGGRVYRRRYGYRTAAEGLPRDPHLDLRRRRTVVFVSGFVDTAAGPVSRVLAGTYCRLGYNVILLDTNRFTTYIYTVAARLTRDVGRRAAEVLANMTRRGLDPKRTELVGLSLGGQVVSYIAKNFRRLTGANFTRLVGLDPAGPCFRNLPPDDRIDASDADHVQIVHTNIDAYGIATPAGHVDFYVNGGEYQPSDVPVLPCTILCSHMRAYFLWLVALEHPDSFVGMRCDTVQAARDAACFDTRPRVTNVMGPNTDYSKPGIFYLTTDNAFPYFMGQNGLKKEYEVWPSHSIRDNQGDVMF